MYDAQHFGTAQRRRRLFAVADFTGRRAGQILFVPKSLRRYFEAGGTPEQGIAAYAKAGAGGTGGEAAGKKLTDEGIYCIAGNIIGRQEHNGGNGMGYQKDLSYTLTTIDRHAVSAPLHRTVCTEVLCMGTSQANAGISDSQSPTLTCAHGQAPILAKSSAAGFVVRRLTPLECERLQGYPDHWTEYGHDGVKISDSKRYQMLGNSVAVPCVAYIMQGVRQALLDNQDKLLSDK